MEVTEHTDKVKSPKLCSGCTISYLQSKDLSEKQVINFLLEHGVIAKSFTCPNCGSNIKLDLSLLTFRCTGYQTPTKRKRQRCTFYKSVLSGSFFHCSRQSVSNVFRLVCAVLWLLPPRNTVIFREVTEHKTKLFDWFLTLREVFIDAVSINSGKLGGSGQTVELAEAKCRSGNIKGGLWDWAFGGINHSCGETFLVPVEEHNFDSLKRIINEKIKPGTLIVTDCTISLKPKEIVELTEDLGVRFISSAQSVISSIIKLHWGEVRKGLPTLSSKRPPHSIDQLAEYLFKCKHPVLNERIHAYFVAAANLYPPVFQVVSAVLWFPRPRNTFIVQEVNEIKRNKLLILLLTIREVFIDAVSANSEKLGGSDQTVELAEAKYLDDNLQHGPWDWAIGGINHSSGETFLVPVEEHNFDSLKQIIHKFIKPGTLIVTDCTKSLTPTEITELTEDLSVRFITPAKSNIRNIIKLHWGEVHKGLTSLSSKTPQHSIDELAEYLFKCKHPVLTERIHAYFVAAANLYPPDYEG